MSPSGCGSSKRGFLQTVLGTARLRKGSAHCYELVFPRKLVFKLEMGAVMLGALCGPCLEWVRHNPQPQPGFPYSAWDQAWENI